jgi:hypothetical protein
VELPYYILSYVRQYHGLEATDASQDEKIKKMSPFAIWIAVTTYEGFINYGDFLHRLHQDCFGHLDVIAAELKQMKLRALHGDEKGISAFIIEKINKLQKEIHRED